MFVYVSKSLIMYLDTLQHNTLEDVPWEFEQKNGFYVCFYSKFEVPKTKQCYSFVLRELSPLLPPVNCRCHFNWLPFFSWISLTRATVFPFHDENFLRLVWKTCRSLRKYHRDQMFCYCYLLVDFFQQMFHIIKLKDLIFYETEIYEKSF